VSKLLYTQRKTESFEKDEDRLYPLQLHWYDWIWKLPKLWKASSYE